MIVVVYQGIAESKTSVGDEDVRNTAVNLVMVSLRSTLFILSKSRHLCLTLKLNVDCLSCSFMCVFIECFFIWQDAVTNPDPIVRCAAGEALGRIAQAVGSPVLTSNITQKIFDQLKAARDAVSRTGFSVALGCIHRYVGGMASGHHLNSSVSILLALAKDNSSSLVQVCWSALVSILKSFLE